MLHSAMPFWKQHNSKRGVPQGDNDVGCESRQQSWNQDWLGAEAGHVEDHNSTVVITLDINEGHHHCGHSENHNERPSHSSAS